MAKNHNAAKHRYNTCPQEAMLLAISLERLLSVLSSKLELARRALSDVKSNTIEQMLETIIISDGSSRPSAKQVHEFQ